MREKPLHNNDNLKTGDNSVSLVLLNDDVNTFEHVIKSLVEICGHDSVQAEQCAMLVHFKGSCEIKKGLPELLIAMSKSLNAKGLHSKVQAK